MTIFSRSPSRLMAPARMPFISWDSKTATGSSAPLSSRVSTRLSRSPRSEPVEDLVQLVGGDAELLGDLGVGGAAMQAVLQGDVGLLDLAGLEPDRPWDPVDGSQLVDDRALDPRDRVGLELDAPFEIVFLDRVDQTEDAV